MAIPIIHFWKNYFENPDEGLGSSYERIILNDKLLQICKSLGAKTLLEAPSFGFTGLSGINSMGLAKSGIDVTLVDDNVNRLKLIKKVWQESNLKLNSVFVNKFEDINFSNNSFDVSWNFSALWFVSNLEVFLQKLCKASKKAVVLSVPNRSGIGYLSQKYTGKDDLKKYLTESYINQKKFIPIMKKNGFRLIEWNYIDCPPWPDIGMHKEKFFKKLGLGFLVKENKKTKQPLTVVNYWQDKNPDFAKQMRKYFWLEKILPKFLKKFWAHHKYYLFIKNEK